MEIFNNYEHTHNFVYPGQTAVPTTGTVSTSTAQTVQTAQTANLFSQLLSAQMNNSLYSIGSFSSGGSSSYGGYYDNSMSVMIPFLMMQMLMSDNTSKQYVDPRTIGANDYVPQPQQMPQAQEAYENAAGSASNASPANSVGQTAAEKALTRVGDPYSQAKRGSGSYVDCSYLTQWAYRQCGVSLPGTAAEQARYCANKNYLISQSELQPGDLVFWTKNGCHCGRYDEIHHVGIYLGDGKVVEASSSKGKVVVNNLWGQDGGRWQVSLFARPY